MATLEEWIPFALTPGSVVHFEDEPEDLGLVISEEDEVLTVLWIDGHCDQVSLQGVMDLHDAKAIHTGRFVDIDVVDAYHLTWLELVEGELGPYDEQPCAELRRLLEPVPWTNLIKDFDYKTAELRILAGLGVPKHFIGVDHGKDFSTASLSLWKKRSGHDPLMEAFVNQYMGIPFIADENVPEGEVRIVNQIHDSIMVEVPATPEEQAEYIEREMGKTLDNFIGQPPKMTISSTPREKPNPFEELMKLADKPIPASRIWMSEADMQDILKWSEEELPVHKRKHPPKEPVLEIKAGHKSTASMNYLKTGVASGAALGGAALITSSLIGTRTGRIRSDRPNRANRPKSIYDSMITQMKKSRV